jgi:hypothetical protein
MMRGAMVVPGGADCRGGSGALFAATVVEPTWLEAVFRVDPDASSGAVEWWYAGLAVAVGSSLLAWAELRRGRADRAR